jgi:hypothetical protein
VVASCWLAGVCFAFLLLLFAQVLFVRQDAVDEHNHGGDEVEPREAAGQHPAWIGNRLVAPREADDANREQDERNPEVGLLPPAHAGVLYHA